MIDALSLAEVYRLADKIRNWRVVEQWKNPAGAQDRFVGTVDDVQIAVTYVYEPFRHLHNIDLIVYAKETKASLREICHYYAQLSDPAHYHRYYPYCPDGLSYSPGQISIQDFYHRLKFKINREHERELENIRGKEDESRRRNQKIAEKKMSEQRISAVKKIRRLLE